MYGRPGIDEFLHLAQSNNLFIDINEGIEDSFALSDYTALANKLMNSSADVVFCLLLNMLLVLRRNLKLVHLWCFKNAESCGLRVMVEKLFQNIFCYKSDIV